MWGILSSITHETLMLISGGSRISQPGVGCLAIFKPKIDLYGSGRLPCVPTKSIVTIRPRDQIWFLPPANEVCCKVMFLHLFVILFTMGEGVFPACTGEGDRAPSMHWGGGSASQHALGRGGGIGSPVCTGTWKSFFFRESKLQTRKYSSRMHIAHLLTRGVLSMRGCYPGGVGAVRGGGVVQGVVLSWGGGRCCP